VTGPDERTRFLASVAARALVQRVAAALARDGIEVLVLKGALLQALVYDDATARAVSDVDLLVRPGEFERATDRLKAEGFSLRFTEDGDRERVFTAPGGGLSLDLHQALFRAGHFRLSPEAVWARARADERLFGVRVHLPDPADLYAHLVGHAATHFLIRHELHHPEDLGLVATRLALDPVHLARRLEEAGLARAAAWLLPMVIEATGDPSSLAVLAALPRDLLARPLARLVRAIVPKLPVTEGLGLIPPNVLHRSWREASRALVHGARRRIARRFR
jgi:AraC-like DNA-binding protein